VKEDMMKKLVFIQLFICSFAFAQTVVTFAVIGDYGNNSSNENKVSQMIDVWNVDFIITVGDNNYPDGQASTLDDNIGQYYRKYIDNYQGTYPGNDPPTNMFFPSLGNHDWHQVPPTPYLDYFDLPGAGIAVGSVPSGNERYYDFIIGQVHFFAIDSDSDEPDGRNSTSIQAKWLQSALSESTLPWKVVYFHHAAYSSSSKHGNNTYIQWPFEEWGADAIFQGHDHTYERIHKDDNDDGIIIPYFVSGNSGASLYAIGDPISGSQYRLGSSDGNVRGALKVIASVDTIRFEEYTITNMNGTETWSTGGSLRDSYKIDFVSKDMKGGDNLPAGFALAQNYPNPFNQETTIRFSLPEECMVLLEVYNSSGQKVDTLFNTNLSRGYYNVVWNASQMPSGIYFYRIRAGSFIDLRKMIFMK
jgi:hypothetical protein